jgi:hypothetical protein
MAPEAAIDQAFRRVEEIFTNTRSGRVDSMTRNRVEWGV